MVSHLEVLVAELSAERVLDVLLPRIAPGADFSIRTFAGKQDLLRKLSDRLAGYASWIRHADRKVVVVDRDDEDCRELKAKIEEHFVAAGLVTLTARSGGARVDACTRIVIEELEAWFFGDVAALRSAYPRISPTLARQRRYRDPDAITGGTDRALEQLLARHGYGESLAKVATAAAVAPHMDVEANRSASFRAFRDGVRRLTSHQETA